jgi:hypothetical protein
MHTGLVFTQNHGTFGIFGSNYLVFTEFFGAPAMQLFICTLSSVCALDRDLLGINAGIEPSNDVIDYSENIFVCITF